MRFCEHYKFDCVIFFNKAAILLWLGSAKNYVHVADQACGFKSRPHPPKARVKESNWMWHKIGCCCRCQSPHACLHQEICHGDVGDWTCIGRGWRPVRMHRPEQRGSGPGLISADCQRYVSPTHEHLFRCLAWVRRRLPWSLWTQRQLPFWVSHSRIKHPSVASENICIKPNFASTVCLPLIKAVLMSWLNRASSGPEAYTQRDVLCRSRGDALLPGGRLSAPQLDLAPGGSTPLGAGWKGEGAGRLLAADQRGAKPGRRGVPLRGCQWPGRKQEERVAPGSRYGSAKTTAGHLLKYLNHGGLTGSVQDPVICFPLWTEYKAQPDWVRKMFLITLNGCFFF